MTATDSLATARDLAENLFRARAARIDAEEVYPWDNVAALRDAGLMGMTIPEAFGGRGRPIDEAVTCVAEVARVCGVTARIVVEANMGAVGAVMAYGSDAQKRRVAPRVLAGDKPAICITEPEAGSAATEMRTTATRHGDTWVLNGMKHWITGGGVSEVHLIFARIVEDGQDRGIGGFIAVRGEDEGLRIGRRIPTMGLRGIPETEVHFEDLAVPAEMALIPSGDARSGFKKLMMAYNAQRCGAAAVALGLGQGGFELARDFLKLREQFGRPLAEFQGLQWMLADMSIGLEASRALLMAAAQSRSAGGFPDMGLAARAKVLCAETAVKVTGDALQMHGAAGYARDLPLERIVRDARMFTIGGGTAQVLRNQIAGDVLGMKLPQTREGWLRAAEVDRIAAE
jgi:alkylation response protein AidB-like acyl-CoA dehydrogenase